MNRLFIALCLVAVCLLIFATGSEGFKVTPVLAQVPAATAPPPPPPLPRETPQQTVPLTPGKTSPAASPGPYATATASAAPTENRKVLDGIWEVQVQQPDDTSYAHFHLLQKATILTGTYIRNGKDAPLTGTLDNKTVHIVVTNADGSTLTFNGTVDGTSDMVGMMQAGSQNLPFTAAYRPKVRFIERAVTGQ